MRAAPGLVLRMASKTAPNTVTSSSTSSVVFAAVLRNGFAGAQLTSVSLATSDNARAITLASTSPNSCRSAEAVQRVLWVLPSTIRTEKSSQWAVLFVAIIMRMLRISEIK